MDFSRSEKTLLNRIIIFYYLPDFCKIVRIRLTVFKKNLLFIFLGPSKKNDYVKNFDISIVLKH